MPDVAVTVADVLGKGGVPALSATSDMPVVVTETKPVAAEPSEAPSTEPVAAETPAEGIAAPVAEAAEATPAEKEVKPDKPAKPGISERFSELSAQRRAADERANSAVSAANQATEALNKALATIEQLSGRNAEAAKTAVDADDPKPKRETFDNPDAYDTALVDWAGRRAAKAAATETEARILDSQKKEKEAADKRAIDETNIRIVNAWNERVGKAKEEMPDYDEVVLRDDLTISMPMTHAILNSDIGPQVAYYLGKNPEEAARIAAIPHPVRQAAEIGRIEAKLSAPKPNLSQAPAPIKPIGAKASAVAKTPAEETMEEYASRRSAELNAQRRSALAGGRSAKSH